LMWASTESTSRVEVDHFRVPPPIKPVHLSELAGLAGEPSVVPPDAMASRQRFARPSLAQSTADRARHQVPPAPGSRYRREIGSANSHFYAVDASLRPGRYAVVHLWVPWLAMPDLLWLAMIHVD